MRKRRWSVQAGAAEVEVDVEFFFEEVGAALGIAKVFGDIAASLHLKSDGAALKSGVQIENPLEMGMIEAFGDADESGEAAGDALVIVVEHGIGGMMAGGFGLAVMVANDSGNDSAIPTFETGDVAIQGEVLAVLVMAAMADAMAQIVE